MVLMAYYFVQTSYNDGTITRLDYTVAMAAQRIVDILARPFPQRSPTVQKLTRISSAIFDSNLLFKVLLAFTDQQLVTGFAILAVGLIQIQTISMYHFAVVQSMASLSLMVHGCTSVVIEDQILENTVMKTWRGIVIICFMMMTLAIQVTWGHEYWLSSYGKYAICIWKSTEGSYHLDSLQSWAMAFYMGVLFQQIMNTLHAYFPQTYGWIFENPVARAIRTGMRKVLLAPRNAYFGCAKRTKDHWYYACLHWPCLAFAIFAFAIFEVVYSQGFNLTLNWFLLVNNIYFVFYLRSNVSGMQGDENGWGFGQAVPMLLLVLPLSLLLETAYGR